MAAPLVKAATTNTRARGGHVGTAREPAQRGPQGITDEVAAGRSDP